MNPPLQTVRLSKQEVDILNSVKRKLKINNWNILCRMAFVLGCADPTPPPPLKMKMDGGVEMDWETFGGDYSEIYAAITAAHKDCASPASIDSSGEYFRKLLFRGILALKMHW